MPSDSPPPTTRQIAEAAGVSHVTVSRVLRNQQSVANKTRQRVLDAAKRLGYRPNPLLGILMHQLRSRKKGGFVATLAWINSHDNKQEWHECPWRRTFLNGVIRRAHQFGYALDEFWTAEPGMTPGRLKKILLSRNIYGLIFPPTSNISFLEENDCSDLAIVFIGQPKTNLGLSFVDSDTASGMFIAVNNLRAQGYRRIGLVLGSSQNPPGHPWRATFLSMQADWRRDECIPPLRLKDALETGQPSYNKWLKQYKPDAVIGCDALLKPYAEAAGFSVPHDLGIAHLHLADDVRGWSGIDTDDLSIGSSAVDVVAAAIQHNDFGPPSVPKRILVPAKWVEGSTTRSKP